ncbi:MAG: AAA family ATPase, partial [Propionibacterium sp.]|nr:AAA family ATPase [Propionibacterium sp.]
MFPRFQATAISDALADTPVVVLEGARQVGKSTLAQHLAASLTQRVAHVTLDDEPMR